jgi:hypothetical protein
MPRGGHNAIPFEQELADALCAWMADGKSLKSWLDAGQMTASGRPLTAEVVYRWIRTVETFATSYAQAKEDRADTLVDEMFEIAADATDDVFLDYREDGTPVAKINGRAMKRAQIEIDVRKWAAEKMRPASYGNRLDVTSGGRAIGAPVKDAAERLHQIMLAAMARQAGEIVPAVTVDAKFVEVEALPSPVPTMDDLLS